MKYDTAVAIGRGASGEVFRAFDPDAGRQVALKLFSATDAESDRRRLREARAQQSLDHPSICEIYEVGVDDAGRGFIAMRYVDGEPLDEVARRLPLSERVRLLRDVVDAVAAAHEAGLVHRDLKPSNVLVEEQPDGTLWPFVLDFGIVHAADETRLTETGQVLGTPGYLSPEQARGDAELSARSDVFSLGVLLYEVLTGRQPFAADSTVASLMAVLEQDPPVAHAVDSEVPRELSSVAAKAMEKDPRRRYADAGALRRDLDRYLAEQQVTARQVGWWGRLLRRAERRPLPFALGALTFLALLAAGAWSLRASLLAEVSARDAERFTRQSAEIASRWRFTQLLPRHDLTRERESLETSLSELRDEVEAASVGSQGAGAAAIGRASLALGRFAEARIELERALELGVSNEIVVLDLARARLDAALDRLRRIDFERDPAVRAAESERVREELRAEVQPLLEGAAENPDALDPSDRLFALAVGAFVADDLERARDLARQAGAQAGWLFEADLLLAEIERLEASRARSADDSDGARAGTSRERRTLEAALERAPSAPLVAQRLCEQGLFQALLEFDQRRLGTPWQETYDRTAEDCEAALEILPCDPAIRLREIELAWRDALAHVRAEGASQVGPLDDIVERARVLAEVETASSEAWLQLGNALYASGQRLLELNDPQAAERLAEAAEALGRSTELAPGLGFAWQSLGLAWTRHGNALDRVSADPRPSYGRAITAFEAGLGGTGVHESRLFNALCLVQVETVYWESQRSEVGPARARLGLAQAVTWCREALERDPQYTSALSNLALASWTGVDLAIMAGDSPLAEAAEAREAFDRLLEVAPQHLSGRNNLAGLTADVARWMLDSGQPSADELRQLIADTDRTLTMARDLLQVIPADAKLHVARLSVARAGTLCRLRIAAASDEAARAEVERAWREADSAVAQIASRTESIDVLLRVAEKSRSRGECELRLERQAAAERSARRAREAAEQALRLDEEFAPLQRELRLVERLEERLQVPR